MRSLNALAVAVVICCALPALADTNVSGPISTNTTWTAANSPYIVNGASSITVNSGVTLTIEPGVIVKFGTGKQMVVQGTLTAVGNVRVADHVHLYVHHTDGRIVELLAVLCWIISESAYVCHRRLGRQQWDQRGLNRN